MNISIYSELMGITGTVCLYDLPDIFADSVSSWWAEGHGGIKYIREYLDRKNKQ